MARKKTEEKRVWPEPPAHLSEWSQERWRRFVGSKISSSGSIDLLQMALEARDTADKAQKIIDADGMIVVTEKTGVGHAHPLLKIQRESRQLFVKVWEKLGLHWVNGDF